MPREPEVTMVKILLQLYEAGLHYLGFVLLAMGGGLVRWFTDIRQGKSAPSSFTGLLMDIAISAFTGVMVALMGVSYQLDPPLIAALCGISGHLGARGIALLQRAVLKRLNIQGGSDVN